MREIRGWCALMVAEHVTVTGQARKAKLKFAILSPANISVIHMEFKVFFVNTMQCKLCCKKLTIRIYISEILNR